MGNPAAWGALLSGLGSLIAALLGMRGVKKRARDECEERIKEMKDAFKAGTRYEIREAERQDAERRKAS